MLSCPSCTDASLWTHTARYMQHHWTLNSFHVTNSFLACRKSNSSETSSKTYFIIIIFFFFIKLTLKFFGFSNWMWICCYLKNSECWWWTKTPNNCWWQDLSWTLTNAKSTSWLERKLEIVYELFTQKCWCLCFISIKAKEWNSLYNILILHQL